jgi:nicotinate-nucleotide adenylyltransferase
LRLGIYGGTFNPPHIGHVKAATAAAEQLLLDVLLVVPAGIPPHKALPQETPTAEDRIELVSLSFAGLPCVRVSDLELKKEGISYTVETIDALKKEYAGADVFLIMGTDMFLTLETWKDAARLLGGVTSAVMSRGITEDRKIYSFAEKISRKYGAGTVVISNEAVAISSTDLRAMLLRREGAGLIEEAAYALIIRKRLYGAKPDFGWLRARAYEMLKPKRIPHVMGCEEEAVKLAARWGADGEDAREAAILHDITKHLELDDQLQLCRKYDIMTDNIEEQEVKLLHSKTGAAVAKGIFGVSDAVRDAIMWHTTGRADMTLLEKIIYIADYIEPTREFEGVDVLRRLAYSDLDLAVIKGLTMSIEDMRSRGVIPHLRTEEARKWLVGHTPQYREG